MEEGGRAIATKGMLGKSLESRDNPFLPGGELSKEAEDLLKRATIVRDKFYLDEKERKQQQQQLQQNAENHAVNTGFHNDNSHDTGVAEERISPTVADRAASGHRFRENGKPGEGTTSPVSSPDGIKVVVSGSPSADGGVKSASSDNVGDEQDKDRAKRRPKCCVVM